MYRYAQENSGYATSGTYDVDKWKFFLIWSFLLSVKLR